MQIVPQHARVLLRVLWPRLQRDQDVAVRIRDRRLTAKGQVDTAVRQADVVQDQVDPLCRNLRADLLLNRCKVLLGVLQPHAHRRVHMQLHLTRVHIREEVLADKERHRQAHRQQQTKQRQRDASVA